MRSSRKKEEIFVKKISLTRGKFTIVDDDAPSWIFEAKWYADGSREKEYAVRVLPRENGKQMKQRLHHVILNCSSGDSVDHKNGDRLDNRRVNLRLFTNTQNQRAFARRRENVSSNFRGVAWNKRDKCWEVQLGRDSVGTFHSESVAAKARDAKARELGWPEEGMNFPK